MMEADPSLPNPVLDRYLTFKRDTPLVTRFILFSQLFFFGLSFFFAQTLSFGLANIPQFTIKQLEIYRILLSPLVCDSFLSLIFAFSNFHGCRLEQSMGSTSFLLLILSIGVLTNMIFDAFAFLTSMITGSEAYLMSSASGIWIVLFGIMPIECSRAPQQQRKILFFPVRNQKYYTVALYFVFILFGLSRWSHIISIGLGYAYANGYLERLKPQAGRCKRLEETVLQSLTKNEGWIACNQILGSGAWRDSDFDTTDERDQGLFSQFRQRPHDTSNNPLLPSAGKEVGNSPSTDGVFSFPASEGHKLGGASNTSASGINPRQARLQAIERRVEATSKGLIV